MSSFLAHSSGTSGTAQLLREHLLNVAQIARALAEPFGAGDEACLAGLLHDLGKYGELFQKRLQGKAKGIDHWSAGAWTAFSQFQSVAAGMAIWGHHLGLQRLDKTSIKQTDPQNLLANHPLNLTLSESDLSVLIQRLQQDGLQPPSCIQPIYDSNTDPVLQMLDVRMLFSALVDADFLDTARHFGEERPAGPDLNAERAFNVLEAEIQRLSQTSNMSSSVREMRSLLWEWCLEAAEEPTGLFTLTAPTGAGKTLAMLGFALKHAMKHSLRRIVVVIPYLSIIEQTAQVYRRLFNHFPDGYLIEHHSLTGTRAPENRGDDQQDEKARVERYLSENWDAPIVITTSVQMLESLFANAPSACRKLHRLAQSVILFDEVQTLPTPLAVPTLQTLSRLATRYGATIVFATATQPAFSHLHCHIHVRGNNGWQPQEIVKDVNRLFNLGRRVQVVRKDSTPTTWQQLADELCSRKQALCVVNIKRHAAHLATMLRAQGERVYHLSTNMCPAHRQKALQEVRQRLQSGERCILISTQCIEAGVDVDFPVVYRAFAPLDSIAQAAGRCNRNGRLKRGEVIVFRPEEEKYPAGAYTQAAGVTRAHLAGCTRVDLYDPALYDGYYRTLYDIARPETQNPELQNALTVRDFIEVARRYRLIPEVAINVLVPYETHMYQQLAQEARQRGLTGDWIRRARPHVISVYRPKANDLIARFLEPIPIRGEPSGDWFIYTELSHYDDLLGLNPKDAPETWIL